MNAPPPPPENAAAALACDPDPSPRSNGGHSNGGAHRGDAYHVTPGPGGSLRGGSAFVVVEDARGDALAGAPWVARVRAYLRKAGGGLDSALPLPAPLDALISTLGAFWASPPSPALTRPSVAARPPARRTLPARYRSSFTRSARRRSSFTDSLNQSCPSRGT